MSTNGVSDAFIVKYDPMGNVLWAKSAGGNNEDVVRSLTTDISGNVIAVGAFLSPIITFSSILLSNPNVIYSIVFIVKYDSLGNALWAKKIGGNFISQGVFGTSITNNSIGNIIVSGYFKADSVRIGTTMLYNYGGWTDIFIAEYNSSGNVLWAKSAGGNFYDVANSITCHNDGSIIITGSFYDLYCYFGSITLMNANWISSPDFFIAKLDTVSITKIKEHIHNNSMNIFPNPTTSQINITSFFIIDKIEITNVMGQIIYSAMPKDKNFKMEIKKEGIYFVTVFANDERISRKVVVHH